MSTDTADASDGETATVGITGEPTGGIRMWLNQTWAFTARTISSLRHNPALVLTAVGFPPMFYFVFTLSDTGSDVLAATAISWGMFGALFACLYVFGNQLATDVEDQRYVTFRSMPIYPSAEFAGRMLAGLLVAVAAMLAGIAAGLVDGASFTLRGPSSLVVVPLAFTLVCLLFMLIAMPIVLLLEDESYVEYVTSIVAVFLFVVTGSNGISPNAAFIDVGVMDTSWLNYLPNSLATRLLAYHLVPADQWTVAGITPPSMPEGFVFLGIVGLYGLLAVALGVLFVRTMMYKLEVKP